MPPELLLLLRIIRRKKAVRKPANNGPRLVYAKLLACGLVEDCDCGEHYKLTNLAKAALRHADRLQ